MTPTLHAFDIETIPQSEARSRDFVFMRTRFRCLAELETYTVEIAPDGSLHWPNA